MERAHLGLEDGEGRAVHRGLRVLEADEQARRGGRERAQVGDVAAPQVGGQRDHRGAIVDGVDGVEVGRGGGEQVADDDGDRAVAIDAEAVEGGDRGRRVVLGEERGGGGLDQLDADHLVAARRQERQVLGLAAQRDQHPAAGRQAIDEAGEERVGATLVKPDLSGLPALLPERCFHGAGVARAGRAE